MARRPNDGGRVRSDRNPSTGAAVLDRPARKAPGAGTKNLLQEEILRLVEASRAGRLGERGRVEQFAGDDRSVVEGVNTMLDAILLPIGEGNRVLAQISAGKIDELITHTYSGDHEKMKQAVNNVAVVLQGLQRELGRLTEASKEGRLAERGKPDQFQGTYAGIVKGVNEMLDAILLPIGEGNRVLAQISQGRIDELIAQTYKGDHEKMKQAVNSVAGALQNMAADTNLLVQAAVAGKLATRADASRHQGDYRKIVEGVNQTLDAVIRPLNVSAEYVDRISKGDIPPKITDSYNGDFNEIKNNLNACIDAVNALVTDGGLLVQAAVAGKLATRADASRHQGDYRKIVEGVNQTLDAVIRPLNVSAEYVDRISKGDIPPKITDSYNGDFNEIKNNLNACIDAVNALVADAGLLVQAAVAGKLATRADASRHQGDYRKIVEGVNQTLDAVIGPLNVSAEYVDRISKGDIPPKITDSYNGDFNEIKNNLNACIDAVNALVADAGLLVQAAVDGQARHPRRCLQAPGDFRKIVEGVNQTLDAVIRPLNVSAEYVDRISKGDIPPKITDSYNGDFNEIKNNLNACIDAVNALVADAGLLVQAAVAGKLATRADATKHQGDYRKIVEGVNQTLDAVIRPLNVSAEYVDRISKGDIPPKITDTYQGDFNEIKNNLNNCIDNIRALVTETTFLVAASGEGKLDTRADATKHQGEYRRIIEGVNEMLDAILIPIGEGNRVLGLVRGGNLRERVDIACKGDHEKMKNAINGVHAWLSDLVVYVTKIANGDMTASVAKASEQDQIHEWLMAAEEQHQRPGGRCGRVGQGSRRRTGGGARRCVQAPGRLPQDHRGRQPDARCDRGAAQGHSAECDDAGLVFRGTDGGQPADGRQRGRDRDAGQRGVGGQRAGLEKRRLGRLGVRADAGLDPRDRQERQRVGPGGQERRQRGAVDQRDGEEAGRIQPGDRQRDQGDHLDRAADQPAGARTPPSRRRAPARPARASRWWPTRSRNWPSRPPRPPRRSARRSRPFRATPRAPSRRSRRSARSSTRSTTSPTASPRRSKSRR